DNLAGNGGVNRIGRDDEAIANAQVHRFGHRRPVDIDQANIFENKALAMSEPGKQRCGQDDGYSAPHGWLLAQERSNGSFECNGCLPARSKVGPWCPADLPHSAPSSKVLAADIGLQTVSILIANPLERLLSRSPQDWELSAAALHRQLRRERALV